MAKCMKCGASLDDGAQFCWSCGTSTAAGFFSVGGDLTGSGNNNTQMQSQQGQQNQYSQQQNRQGQQNQYSQQQGQYGQQNQYNQQQSRQGQASQQGPLSQAMQIQQGQMQNQQSIQNQQGMQNQMGQKNQQGMQSQMSRQAMQIQNQLNQSARMMQGQQGMNQMGQQNQMGMQNQNMQNRMGMQNQMNMQNRMGQQGVYKQPNNNNNNKNMIPIIFAIIVSLIVISVGVVFAIKYLGKDKEETTTSQVAENSTEGGEVTTLNPEDVLTTEGTGDVTLETTEASTEATTELPNVQISEEVTAITFYDITFYVPKDYLTLVSQDKGSYNGKQYICFKQKKSENDYGGTLFTIYASPNEMNDNDNADLYYLGKSSTYYYYMSHPTDVQFNDSDANIMAEYQALWIEKSALIYNIDKTTGANYGENGGSNGGSTSGNSGSNGGSTSGNSGGSSSGNSGGNSGNTIPYQDQYIFWDSNSRYLTREEVARVCTNKDIADIALNELYARHHRKFKSDLLKNHFEATDWYDGYIEPSDFTDEYKANVFNDYENKNLNIMLQYEKDMGWR